MTTHWCFTPEITRRHELLSADGRRSTLAFPPVLERVPQFQDVTRAVRLRICQRSSCPRFQVEGEQDKMERRIYNYKLLCATRFGEEPCSAFFPASDVWDGVLSFVCLQQRARVYGGQNADKQTEICKKICT
jgi:hypothetical protein